MFHTLNQLFHVADCLKHVHHTWHISLFCRFKSDNNVFLDNGLFVVTPYECMTAEEPLLSEDVLEPEFYFIFPMVWGCLYTNRVSIALRRPCFHG